MEILKRILKVIILLVSFPIIIILTLIATPILALFILIKYVLIGGEVDDELWLETVDWLMDLPFYFIDKF